MAQNEYNLGKVLEQCRQSAAKGCELAVQQAGFSWTLWPVRVTRFSQPLKSSEIPRSGSRMPQTPSRASSAG